MIIRIGVLAALLVGCGSGKVVIEDPPPAQPTTTEPTPQQLEDRRRAKKRKMCQRLEGVAVGAVRSKEFDVASRAARELGTRGCPAAMTGAVETRVAVAIRRYMTRPATGADMLWIERDTGACGKGRDRAACARALVAKCPRPKPVGSFSKRVSAYTRVALTFLRARPHRSPAGVSLWIAAQRCGARTVGIDAVARLVEEQASQWAASKDGASLRRCLNECSLTPGTRARLDELERGLPKAPPAPVDHGQLLAKLTRKLNRVNAQARSLLRTRPFDGAAARRLFADGTALSTQGDALVAKRRKQISRQQRRVFRTSRRAWRRYKRRLRRKLRKR